MARTQKWCAAVGQLPICFCRSSTIPRNIQLGAGGSDGCGLPVVVSDWDGYRATVSDGVEGFPFTAPGYARQGLALEHDLGMLTYQDYVGAVAQRR